MIGIDSPLTFTVVVESSNELGTETRSVTDLPCFFDPQAHATQTRSIDRRIENNYDADYAPDERSWMAGEHLVERGRLEPIDPDGLAL